MGLIIQMKVAKYDYVFDKDAIEPLHWFAVVIKYDARMVLAGQVF